MALRVAVATGNWSNPSTWYLGVKPTVGDIVASNGFTVTIDENINISFLTNTAQLPISIIPLMTSSTTPSGVVSANNYFQGSPTYAPYKAFDRSVSTNANHWLTDGAVPLWLEYEFPSSKVIVAYSLETNYNNLPNSWQFQAWNGSTWVVLDTVTGNTSNNYQTRTFTNTVTYTRYRIYITALNGSNTGTGELRMFDVAADSASSVAGGGFIVSTTQTITCTNSLGILPGPSTALTVSANSPSVVTINSNLSNSGTTDNTLCVLKSGTCTLNITGSTLAVGVGSGRSFLSIASIGTVNFVGNVDGFWAGCYGIILAAGSSGAVLNLTGDVNPDKSLKDYQNENCIIVSTVCTINVTGNIYGGYGASVGITVNAAASIYVTGNVYGGYATNSTSSNGTGISSASSGIINVVGMLNAQHTPGYEGCAIVSSSGSALNIFSGPFVCSPYGFFPYQVVRMHLIPTTNSYIEFRDETTNGAVSPGAIAPATQLVSPATLVDNLAPSDVRFGTSYALGTLTGTLRMPVANQVTFGVQVDNTFGNAVLTADGIWNYLVTNLNTPDSIGMRLKNVSTPQTTGEQLEAFLRLD
jgi:hypothetical protein